MSANDEFKDSSNLATERPSGPDTQQNDYASRTGQDQYNISVDSDSKDVESGLKGDQDTDEQLVKDDREAIDQGNILDGGKTRGAKPQQTYKEPGDEEGLEIVE